MNHIHNNCLTNGLANISMISVAAVLSPDILNKTYARPYSWCERHLYAVLDMDFVSNRIRERFESIGSNSLDAKDGESPNNMSASSMFV